MARQSITYDVIGKATVERGGDHWSHTIKLLYKGDGTPWWTCAAGLELPVSKELFDATPVGAKITIAIEVGEG